MKRGQYFSGNFWKKRGIDRRSGGVYIKRFVGEEIGSEIEF